MNSLQRIQLALFCIPVALAHYYNLDRTGVTLLMAFASVFLLVFATTALIGRLEPGRVRTAVGLVLIYLLSFYYASQYISYYLQGSYFNQQYFFHFNLNTLIETRTAYVPLTLSVLGWTAAVLGGFYLFRNRLSRSGVPKSGLVALLFLALLLDPGLRPAAIDAIVAARSPQFESLEDIDWNALALNPQAIENEQNSAIAGKNLLFVFLEGLEAIYSDEAVFPGLMPELQRLNAEGLQLNNLRQIEGSGWTMGGIVSSLCATPLLYESSLTGNDVLFSRLLDEATCLPDVLEQAGYEQVFMGGASLDFAGKGGFLSQHGFDTVLGLHELSGELADPNYVGGWGLYDDTLFGLALDKFNSLAATEQPFNLTLLTVDTHHPTGEPSASCPLYSAIDNMLLHSVHCTDFLLGQFIDEIKKSPAYADTIVVLVSDHLSMRNIAFSLFPDGYDRTLYFNVLNTGSEAAQAVAATPLDIAPSVLDWMGVEHDVAFLAGVSLAETAAAVGDREFSDTGRWNAIRYLNSRHLSVQDGRSVYTLNRQALEEYEFATSVENINYVAGSLIFDATTADPYFFLPPLMDVSYEDAMLYVTLDNDEDLSVALYFESELGAGYSEENTLVRFINPGINQVAFDLKDVATGSRLRIDPGNRAGRYRIRDIEIRAQ